LKGDDDRRYSWSLLATLLLAISFLGSQLLGWKKLVAQGVYLSGQPRSSFFYLFTGAHGIHVAGGIIALSYLVFRNHLGWNHPEAERRKASNDVVSLYWHFMGGLWIWLFLLLLIWR
jgi:cytochrome c oxidase subunit 3